MPTRWGYHCCAAPDQTERNQCPEYRLPRRPVEPTRESWYDFRTRHPPRCQAGAAAADCQDSSRESRSRRGGCFNGSVMTAAVLAAASTSTDGPPLRQSVNKSHCQDLVVQISLVPFKQTVQAKKPNYRERVRGNNTRLEENLMCGRESRQSCPTRCRHTITHN